MLFIPFEGAFKMKKSLTALLALALAFVFGTATLVYAETPATNGAAPSAETKKDEKTEVKKAKKTKKMKKKAKKEKKEEMKEAAPAEPAPAK
jgi:hypothetical protein